MTATASRRAAQPITDPLTDTAGTLPGTAKRGKQ